MKKNTIYLILTILAGVLLFFIWMQFVDLSELRQHLKSARVDYLLLMILFYILSYFIRSQRWRTLLKPLVKISPYRCFLLWTAGNFINYLVPIRAGELGKSIFLKKTNKVPVSESLPSVFIDKMFDMLSVFVVLTIIPFLNITLPKAILWLIVMVVIVFMTALFVLIMAAFNKELIIRILHKLFFWVPAKFEEKVKSVIELFIHGLSLFREHKFMIPKVIVLSLVATATDGLFFYFVVRAFQVSISYFKVLFGYTLLNLSYIFPHPPVQLGSNELIVGVIFHNGFGLDKNLVAAITVTAHLLTGIVIISIGLFAIGYLGLKLFDKKKSN